MAPPGMFRLRTDYENGSPYSNQYEPFDSLHVAGPIPVATRSKGWVFGSLLAVTAVSNPVGGMDVCVL